jgi:hypothetical protein
MQQALVSASLKSGVSGRAKSAGQMPHLKPQNTSTHDARDEIGL